MLEGAHWLDMEISSDRFFESEDIAQHTVSKEKMRRGKSREHRKRIAKEAIGQVYISKVDEATSMKGHDHDRELVD